MTKRDEALLPKKPWPSRPQRDTILSCRRFKAGYQIDTMLVDNLPYMGRPYKKYAQARGRFMIMRVARTHSGAYIGNSRWAHRIFVNWGLIDVQPSELGQTCCVGFSPASKRWFGWSHRARCGFGVGDKLFDPDWRPRGASEEEMDKMPFVRRGGRTIRSLAEAKRAALAFAEYVS